MDEQIEIEIRFAQCLAYVALPAELALIETIMSDLILAMLQDDHLADD